MNSHFDSDELLDNLDGFDLFTSSTQQAYHHMQQTSTALRFSGGLAASPSFLDDTSYALPTHQPMNTDMSLEQQLGINQSGTATTAVPSLDWSFLNSSAMAGMGGNAVVTTPSTAQSIPQVGTDHFGTPSTASFMSQLGTFNFATAAAEQTQVHQQSATQTGIQAAPTELSADNAAKMSTSDLLLIAEMFGRSIIGEVLTPAKPNEPSFATSLLAMQQHQAGAAAARTQAGADGSDAHDIRRRPSLPTQHSRIGRRSVPLLEFTAPPTNGIAKSRRMSLQVDHESQSDVPTAKFTAAATKQQKPRKIEFIMYDPIAAQKKKNGTRRKSDSAWVKMPETAPQGPQSFIFVNETAATVAKTRKSSK